MQLVGFDACSFLLKRLAAAQRLDTNQRALAWLTVIAAANKATVWGQILVRARVRRELIS